MTNKKTAKLSGNRSVKCNKQKKQHDAHREQNRNIKMGRRHNFCQARVRRDFFFSNSFYLLSLEGRLYTKVNGDILLSSLVTRVRCECIQGIIHWILCALYPHVTSERCLTLPFTLAAICKSGIFTNGGLFFLWSFLFHFVSVSSDSLGKKRVNELVQ